MEEAWKRFEQSGSVSDYLTYVSENRDKNGVLDDGFRAVSGTEDECIGKAGGTDGTISKDDRNRTFGDQYR